MDRVWALANLFESEVVESLQGRETMLELF